MLLCPDMIVGKITSNRCNYIWLCSRSLEGETLQLQNGGHPCDVAQSYSSSVDTLAQEEE